MAHHIVQNPSNVVLKITNSAGKPVGYWDIQGGLNALTLTRAMIPKGALIEAAHDDTLMMGGITYLLTVFPRQQPRLD